MEWCRNDMKRGATCDSSLDHIPITACNVNGIFQTNHMTSTFANIGHLAYILEFRPVARIIRGGFKVWDGRNPRGMECMCVCHRPMHPPICADCS